MKMCFAFCALEGVCSELDVFFATRASLERKRFDLDRCVGVLEADVFETRTVGSGRDSGLFRAQRVELLELLVLLRRDRVVATFSTLGTTRKADFDTRELLALR